MLKEDISHDIAVRLVKEEFEKYKANLEKKGQNIRSQKRPYSLTALLSSRS